MSAAGNLELADIFTKFEHLLGKMPKSHWKVVNAIRNCRTSVLGGHKLECDSCDYEKLAYNSCRNRHCPKCQFTTRCDWVEKRVEELLPSPYFHVVFTVPSELRLLILRNKEVSYNIMFKAASETLKEVASHRMNIELGCIGVLHTWSQSLIDHPHLHFIVPGGGLNPEKTRWVKCQENYLLPVYALGEVFRAKIIKFFEAANLDGDLQFKGEGLTPLSNPGIFNDLLIKLASKNFVVDSRPPFAGPETVIKYLGGYTHRIAISNYRLVKLEGENVHFTCRDPKDPAQKKVMVLHVREFMRRFLLHVLPKGFVRIRHYGILGSRPKKKTIALVRKLEGVIRPLKEKVASWQELYKKLTGTAVNKCPRCESGLLEPEERFENLLRTG